MRAMGFGRARLGLQAVMVASGVAGLWGFLSALLLRFPSSAAYGVKEVLWFEVVKPEDVAYYYKILPAKDFGGIFERPFQNEKLVVTDPDHACSKILLNAEEIHGNIAFIERGGCSFLTKAINAELHGAVAAIIFDYQDDTHAWVNMIADETNRKNLIGIPTFFLMGIDGYKIKEAMERSSERQAVVNLPVNVTGKPIPQNQPPWDYW